MRKNLKAELREMKAEEAGEGEAPVKKGKHSGKLAKPGCK